MKRLALVFVVAGCVSGPPPDSPQLKKVIADCDAGNKIACQTVQEVREEQARIYGDQTQAAGPPLYFPPMQQFPQMQPMPAPQRITTTCHIRSQWVTCY